MTKRLATLFLSLSWALGFCSLFLFQAPDLSLEKPYQEVQVRSVESMHFSTAVPHQLKVEIPSFKIDWNSFGKFNAEDLFRFLPFQKASFQVLEELYQPQALFDVKITFLHFFFTW
ncbi:hypothetical protein [Algoriphagus confluentis]|uniref:Uncharacterized protein n=1 Tax=Algoriphagus confluentis TaxID=1697556 RepID=A0ABQ6PMQ4_9BACT|nr:hypothetical protein Aconfl_11830 [Algoriphagus confluentis]